MECARLEGLVEATVWVLANLEKKQIDADEWGAQPIGSAFTTHLPLLQWLKLISVLIESTIVDKSIKDRWKVLFKRLDDLRIMRNDLMHARWKLYNSAYVISKTTARERIENKIAPVTSTEIEGLASAAEALANDPNRFRFDLFLLVQEFHRNA